jgi:hypothetical protein
MWCPAPLPKGELHRRKRRSDKYKPPAGRLFEFYESDSSVEADEFTDVEAGADLDAGVVKSRRRTRSTIVKKSASAVATAIYEVGCQTHGRLRPGDLCLRYTYCHIPLICFRQSPPRSCLVRRVLWSPWIRSFGESSRKSSGGRVGRQLGRFGPPTGRRVF